MIIQADSHRILADVAEDLSEEERASLARRMAASIAERAVLARAAAGEPHLAEDAEHMTEAEREAMEALAAQAGEEAAAALAAADGARVRLYTHRLVLEDEREEEPEPRPE